MVSTSRSRSQDNGEDTTIHNCDSRDSGAHANHLRPCKSKVSHEQYSSGSSSHDQMGQSSKTRLLNPYGLTASTIPPFALSEQAKTQEPQSVQSRNGTGRVEKTREVEQQLVRTYKDPFLVSHNENWDRFVENVGSNVAYLHKAAQEPESSISVDEGVDHPFKEVLKEESSSSSDELKNEKEASGPAVPPAGPAFTATANTSASHNIFADLSDSWGGSERLNAIFNGPMLDSRQFTNDQDRQDWANHLESIKAFFYSEGANDRDLEAGLQGDGANDTGRDADNNRLQAFLEKQRSEFKEKRKHWRRLERQKKQKWLPTLQRILLGNQYLPLGFRTFIVIICIISLGLAIRIFQNSHSHVEELDSSVPQQPSTIMAICVNTVAVVYLFYISYDEFSGKPLGLRNPFGKLKLILMDLLFIIFSSANLALTFNTLYDKQWVCTAGQSNQQDNLPKIDYICRKQRALAAFLFVVLFMWVVTFSISILRVVEKMSSNNSR
ncbi:LADA_0F13322g1_1 [Lachancea dasiensis]|uniref:LADA_0F13322g1_1 n=1 Tax=Lachancea dasiensis TaxID=1072105 RepID=A0A1G4JN01_9SACH|nr:LADA_0F13322g1_1 [Lachancea dasiensis]